MQKDFHARISKGCCSMKLIFPWFLTGGGGGAHLWAPHSLARSACVSVEAAVLEIFTGMPAC